jgi:hypothetical protein
MEQQVTITWEQIAQWLSEPLHAAIVGALTLVYVVGWCAVFARTGRHFLLGLLMVVPGVNVLTFLLLAFAPWPSLDELYRLRRLDHAVALAGKRYSRAA